MSLDSVLRNPDVLRDASRAELVSLLTRAAAVQSSLAAAFALRADDPSESETDIELLSVEDVARILGKPEDWVYRERLPGRTKVGHSVRFRRDALERFIARRSGGP